jgi:predicted RND superfamily exporter protein
MKRLLEKFVDFCIYRRVACMSILGVLTLVMLYYATQIEIKTVFNDLLPADHPYVAINNEFKQTFGGSNIVSIMLEVKDGEVFQEKIMKKVQDMTRALQRVDAVNPFQVISLASKKLRDIKASSEGIVSSPLMWPDIPKDKVEMKHLRDAVLENTLVYGRYVSLDLKATLITVDFYDQLLDYTKAFPQINKIIADNEGDGVHIRVAGEPMLYGWVNHYMAETMIIFAITVCCMVLVLFIITRTWRGTMLPLLAGVVSAIWGVGSSALLGFNMDPLLIVLAFLITARAISHSVQLVTRFDDEVSAGAESTIAAARAAMIGMFKPGVLGVGTDAGCAFVVVFLTTIPLLQKVSIIGGLWVSSILVSGVVMTPVLLSWCKNPKGYAHPINVFPAVQKILGFFIWVVTSRCRYFVLIGTAIIFVISGLYALNLKVGDANPGSPILWQHSQYNEDWGAINDQFQGSDRMFVVLSAKEHNYLKEGVCFENMDRLQRYMEAQPEVGGSLSFSDVIPGVKRMLRENNPRYKELGNNVNENGELIYMFTSGTEPGDMDRYTDAVYMNYAVTMYFHDHQGETIRTAFARVKEFIEKNPLEKAEYKLAGGLIGVLGAVNEVILAGQIESIAFSLLIVIFFCVVIYRSMIAGMFFLTPVVIANTLTFSYMAYRGIGMSINTLPVVALGIGLGVDYTFYIIDGVREELFKEYDLVKALAKSLSSAGRGVFVTCITLTVAVVFWIFSSLRFQAEMGLLIGIWLFISAVTSLFVMPSIVYIFKPEFVVGKEGLGK